MSGIDSPTLSIGDVGVGDVGFYSVWVSNAWGALASVEALLGVNGYPITWLFVQTDGGGEVHGNPFYAPYPEGTEVTLTAFPALGWDFLTWLNDAAGTNVETTLIMNESKCVRALFGSRLYAQEVAGGTVLKDPYVDLYPFGTPVRLTALPDNGYCFAGWVDAGGATANPRAYVNNVPNYSVQASFEPLSSGRFALTVLSDGRGGGSTAPWANQYVEGTVVTNAASAEPGQLFLGWTGDTNGAWIDGNKLILTMDASRVITANFTKRPRLVLDPCWGAIGQDGFHLSVVGQFGERYEIQSADGDPVVWTPLVTLTNTFGTVQFTDCSATNNQSRLYRAVSLPLP